MAPKMPSGARKAPVTRVRVFSPWNTVSAGSRPRPASVPPPSTPSGSETVCPSI